MKSFQKDKNKRTIDSLRKKDLIDFCKRVDIKFQNIELLEQAFHHRSSVNENKALKNNERLEFLGDSVLGMVTAAYLYESLDNPEGDLAKIKSAVVSEKALAPVALKFGIDSLLIMGHGEEKTGGRQKPAILADCMEAIIGAYYLDSGYKAAQKYVLSFIIPAINEVLQDGLKDFKTLLQEKYQKISKKCPVYELVEKSGPDHDQTFVINVHLGDKIFGPARGKNKREAEMLAAKMALDNFDFQ
ncbi:MAG: ribonuclease III [Treponema sp.]|nr:ribonuclease III [Treponema sp.]